jgi:hypothetical protein
VVEDSFTQRLCWKLALQKGCTFHGFGGTKEFFASCDSDPSFLQSLECIVTDFHFAPGDPHDGALFARALREKGYTGIILRSSSELDMGAEIESLFDGDVGKMALPWPEFESALNSAKRRRQHRS